VKKKIMGIILVLATSFVVAEIAPALAWDLHMPDGVKILYVTGGHSGDINLPANFPLNKKPWYVDKMRIVATYVEGGNAYTGPDILVWLHLGGVINSWVTWADFIGINDPVGTAWLIDSYKGLPAENPQNFKYLANDIMVDRHGNSISVSLKKPQTLVATVPFTVYFTLPAFDLTLEKVDGSVHRELQIYQPISKWTLNKDEMGFNGNGAFTCPDWGYNKEPITDCFILMNGINTYIPPPP
jgi:hypothetical protein